MKLFYFSYQLPYSFLQFHNFFLYLYFYFFNDDNYLTFFFINIFFCFYFYIFLWRHHKISFLAPCFHILFKYFNFFSYLIYSKRENKKKSSSNAFKKYELKFFIFFLFSSMKWTIFHHLISFISLFSFPSRTWLLSGILDVLKLHFHWPDSSLWI